MLSSLCTPTHYMLQRLPDGMYYAIFFWESAMTIFKENIIFFFVNVLWVIYFIHVILLYLTFAYECLVLKKYKRTRFDY